MTVERIKHLPGTSSDGCSCTEVKFKIKGRVYRSNQVPEMLALIPAHRQILLSSRTLASLSVSHLVRRSALSHFAVLHSRGCPEPEPHLNVVFGWCLGKTTSPSFSISWRKRTRTTAITRSMPFCLSAPSSIYLEPVINVSLDSLSNSFSCFLIWIFAVSKNF